MGGLEKQEEQGSKAREVRPEKRETEVTQETEGIQVYLFNLLNYLE